MYQNLTRNNSVNIPSGVPKALQNGSHSPSIAGSRGGTTTASATDSNSNLLSNSTHKGQSGTHAPPSTLGK